MIFNLCPMAFWASGRSEKMDTAGPIEFQAGTLEAYKKHRCCSACKVFFTLTSLTSKRRMTASIKGAAARHPS